MKSIRKLGLITLATIVLGTVSCAPIAVESSRLIPAELPGGYRSTEFGKRILEAAAGVYQGDIFLEHYDGGGGCRIKSINKNFEPDTKIVAELAERSDSNRNMFVEDAEALSLRDDICDEYRNRELPTLL